MPLLNFVIMYDKIIKLSFKEEYLMEINDILEKFNFKGELEECNVFGSGHINTTYLAKYIENGKEKKYVVQKVNTNIFPDIDSLMNNVFSVTEFLRKKIIEKLRLQKSRLLPLIQQIFQCRLRISILISSVMQVFLLNQM